MRVWVCHCAGRCLADLEPIVTHVAFADDAGFLIFFVGEGRADIHAGRVLAVVAGGASSGVDKFYGFIGGETDQWYSLIYDGTTRVTPPHTKGYHFTVDMTNQAINWVKAQQSMTPDKPFFVYFATGTVHAPHHVPKEWADKYKGQFDKGWDQVRKETTARQIDMGMIPKGTKLAPRPKDIKAWETLPEPNRKLFCRQAEVFAGFMEQTDHEVGRFMNALEDIGEMDNTLFIYIAGDNGTSAEGGFVGMYNEMTYFNSVTEKVEDLIPLIDKWGGPYTFPHMAAGWAVAFDAPFTWTKQVASDFGGTRNGMVIHWPKGIGIGRDETRFTGKIKKITLKVKDVK